MAVKWRHVVSLVVPFIAFAFGIVSLALPSWYTLDVHGADGSILETRTYGLFVWSTDLPGRGGSQKYVADNYRTQWMLACAGLMLAVVVFFGLSFVILVVYFLKKYHKDKNFRLLHASQAMTICGCICNLIVVCAWSARLAEYQNIYGKWERAEFGPGFFTSIISLIVGVIAVVEDGWPSDEDPDEETDPIKKIPNIRQDDAAKGIQPTESTIEVSGEQPQPIYSQPVETRDEKKPIVLTLDKTDDETNPTRKEAVVVEYQ